MSILTGCVVALGEVGDFGGIARVDGPSWPNARHSKWRQRYDRNVLLGIDQGQQAEGSLTTASSSQYSRCLCAIDREVPMDNNWGAFILHKMRGTHLRSQHGGIASLPVLDNWPSTEMLLVLSQFRSLNKCGSPNQGSLRHRRCSALHWGSS